MKRAKCHIWVVLAIGAGLFAGCGRRQETSRSDSAAPAPLAGVSSTPPGKDTNSSDAVIAEMRKTLDFARSHQLKPSLPNFAAGPGLPPPLGLNFYSVNWHYPAYLLCEYPISENHYDQSNEPAWFKAALLQIRATGRDRFPPLKWVAVAICNRAEHKDASTFARSFKVAAIFNIDEVFNVSRDLSGLTARAKMDRQPFMYDTQQPTPGEQQRWLIVEKHAAAAPTSTATSAGKTAP